MRGNAAPIEVARVQVAIIQEHATHVVEQTLSTPLLQSVFRAPPRTHVTPPRTDVLPSALRGARAQPSPEDSDVLASAMRQTQGDTALRQRASNAQA